MRSKSSRPSRHHKHCGSRMSRPDFGHTAICSAIPTMANIGGRYAKRMEATIRQRVQTEIAQWQAMMLPEYNERLAEASRIYQSAQGLHDAGAVQQVSVCRSRGHLQQQVCERPRRAKPVAGGEQDVAVGEDKKPSGGRPMPETLQELWQAREKQRQANSDRAKAAHARAKAKRQR